MLTDQFREQLAEKGINLDAVRHYVETWCRCRLEEDGRRGERGSAAPGNKALLVRELDSRPELKEALSNILAELLKSDR